MKNIAIILLLLCATASAFAQDYDTPTGATIIPHQDNWSSGVNAYSTAGATIVSPSSSCGQGANRWFKFLASDQFVRIYMTPNGVSYARMALWEYDGTTFTELDCILDPVGQGGANPISIASNSLTIGSEYYLSVASPIGYQNSFDLAISVQYDYDYPEGATTVPHQNGWISESGSFTTKGAKNHGPASTCGSGTNRWFKFDANTPFIKVNVDPAGAMYTRLALWEFDGTTYLQLDCNIDPVGGSGSNTISVSSSDLSTGSEYFISVASAPGYEQDFILSIEGRNSSYWTLQNGTLSPLNLQNGVGIGTSIIPQDYLLAVDGRVIVEEVRVELIGNWPDYVFGQDYKLLTLKQIKEYIEEHKHLPEIPSASEVEKNGIILGDMNLRLLKKIEELTLHQIQLMEEIEAMKKELEVLKN